MRYTMRAMLGMLLAVVTWTHGFAEEAKRPWWRFGGDESASAPAAPAAPTFPPSTAPEVPKAAWPPLPKFSWSEMTIQDESSAAATQKSPSRSRFGKAAFGQSRSNWAQTRGDEIAAASSPSPWQSFTNGARRFGDGTRNAWHKTVDFVTPDVEPVAPSVTEREPRESWWSRMWGTSEETTEGPQTVTEWMAQDRLDP